MPKVGLAVERNQVAALFPDIAVVKLQAAIVHPIENEIEIRTIVWLSANIEVMGDATLSEPLGAICCIVAAIDGPEVTEPQHLAATRAVSHIRHEQPTLARHPFERTVEVRSVKEGNPLQPENGVVGDGAVAWDNVKNGSAQDPPRFGEPAVSH